jgi:hypothetical protein
MNDFMRVTGDVIRGRGRDTGTHLVIPLRRVTPIDRLLAPGPSPVRPSRSAHGTTSDQGQRGLFLASRQAT